MEFSLSTMEYPLPVDSRRSSIWREYGDGRHAGNGTVVLGVFVWT